MIITSQLPKEHETNLYQQTKLMTTTTATTTTKTKHKTLHHQPDIRQLKIRHLLNTATPTTTTIQKVMSLYL